MTQDEILLIQRAKQGDRAAFAEIYDRHQSAIYRYIFYQVSDVATAEDLTSEVFVRLVEKIDRFTYQGRPLLAWLYTIARNLVMDHHRRAGKSQLLSLDEQLVADAIAPEEATERRLTQDRLTAAIAHLTEDQRQVILLKFVEGLGNETTAQALGKTVGSVKSLQHRALAALRRILEKNGD
jgi:RNA polymerase sigma-70 factor (ECF subfamily)